MLRTAARASALCTLVVVCQPDVWNSESCFLQVNYDLAEHDTSATAVAAGNGSQSAHGHFQGLQSDTKGLSRTAATADAKSLTQGKQNVSSIGSAPATLNATTRDFLSTARHECMLFFGVPKFYWAVLCDAWESLCCSFASPACSSAPGAAVLGHQYSILVSTGNHC